MITQQTPFYLTPRLWGLILGPLFLFCWIIWGNSAGAGVLDIDSTLDSAQHKLAGIILFTILWWLTEPIPIPITAVLAVVLCFLFHIPQDILNASASPPAVARLDRDSLKMILVPFADPTVYFLFGGMCLGMAMTRHGLDKRFAHARALRSGMGRTPTTVLFGIGLAVTIISTVISNTAATAMILPIALQVLTIMDSESTSIQSLAGSAASRTGTSAAVSPINWTSSPYGTALLLMTAYGSSVGGICTPIGTTTNVVAMGLFQQSNYFGKKFDFFRWMQIGIPMSIILFVALFLWLRFCGKIPKIEIAKVRENLMQQRSQLGRWSIGERNTLFVFITAMALWTLPGLIALLPTNLEQIAQRIIPDLPEELVALMIPVGLFILPSFEKEHRGTLAESDLR